MGSNYTKDPNTVIFDDKYVVFNPLHSEAQYLATRDSIDKLGQLEPILMLNGQCVDGRHRVKVAIELGIMVRCADLDPNSSEEDIVVRCNTNVMSGRDYSGAQKAIQALKLVNEYNMLTSTAAKFMKIDRRLVSYASTIKGLGRQDLLDALMEDKKVQLANMARPSKSLEVICKHVKTEAEETTVVIDDSERVKFNPNAAIKTEQGKSWYYLNVAADNVPEEQIGTRMKYVELANYKFRGDLDD